MSEQGYPGFIAFLKKQLQENQSVFGGPMGDEERATYASDIKIASDTWHENPGVEMSYRQSRSRTVSRYTVAIAYRRTLPWPRHTSGDLVVHLPQEES